MTARTLLQVSWIDPGNARITLPDGTEFSAAKGADGWATAGNPATDAWSFIHFEGLLAFVQERSR